MLTDEQIRELETKHRRVERVVSRRMKRDAQGQDTKEPEWEVVLRAPKHSEWKRFRAQLHNDATKSEAQENLARICVVYPTREAFDAMLEDFPAIGDACGNTLSSLAGFTADESAKS